MAYKRAEYRRNIREQYPLINKFRTIWKEFINGKQIAIEPEQEFTTNKEWILKTSKKGNSYYIWNDK
jgi:hypothetical protein